MQTEQTITTKYQRIFNSLKDAFKKKEETFKEIRDLLAPGTGLFDDADNLENQKINYIKLLDSEPNTYLDTTIAGLYGGLINPASRWFDLSLNMADPRFYEMDYYQRAQITESTREFLYFLFAKTNFYSAMRPVINEWVRYGVGTMLIEERDWDVIFFNPLTIGEYNLGIDCDGKYDKLSRCFKMKPENIIKQFGSLFTPKFVKEAYDAGMYDKDFDVFHLICPNPNDGLVPSEFKYVDLYWMCGCDCCNGPHYLRKSGFKSNPIVVFSWERKNARTIYPIGLCEKMLGDMRELQQTVKALNIHKAFLAKPALALHESLGKKPILPGATFYTDQDPTKVAAEIYRVNSYIGEFEDSRSRLLDKIRKMSYADILLLFAQKDRSQMTATEVTALTNEQMTLLAPIYLQAKSGLDAIFRRVLDICLRRGFLNNVPGIGPNDIEIEFLSSIAKAQRMAEVGAMQELVAYIAQLGQVKPGALDYINEDALVIDLAERLGNASKINSSERVAQLREQQAQMQQEQMDLQRRAEEAKIAKDEAKAQVAKDNILGQKYMAQTGEEPPSNGITIPNVGAMGVGNGGAF